LKSNDLATLPSSTRFLVPDNELRQAVNKARFESSCKSLAVASGAEGARDLWNKGLPIMILAEVWTRRPRGKLAIDRADPAICNFVWHHVSDDVFDDKCGSLPIILGSAYRITDNLALGVGVAKNMIVLIKDIRIDRPHVNVTWDARFNCHVVSADKVQSIIVNLSIGSWGERALCTGLQPGNIPLRPSWVCARLPLKGSKTVPIKCLMFSLTSAWALSCHRFQGQSLDDLCLHGHVSSRSASKLVDKHYAYVAVSRVRTLAGLSMTEPLPSDLSFYEPDLSFLVHKSKLDVRTLKTKLKFAEAWQLDAEAVRACTHEIQEAEQTLATLGQRLAEELDRKEFLLMHPSDRKSREKSSKDGKKRKAAPMDATARKVKRARQDGVPDQDQNDQLLLEMGLLDQQTWQRARENGVPDEALMHMDRPDWGLPDEMHHADWGLPVEIDWQIACRDGVPIDEYEHEQEDFDFF
jgi:hypothetical protein